jgi:uncharacterized membrane protein (DUF2068 family)
MCKKMCKVQANAFAEEQAMGGICTAALANPERCLRQPLRERYTEVIRKPKSRGSAVEQKWISLFGNVDISDGTLINRPLPSTSNDVAAPGSDGSPPIPQALVRSNIEFEQGTITWESKLNSQADRVQLMLPARPPQTGAALEPSSTDLVGAELAVGLNVLGAPYGFGLWSAQVWNGLLGVGQGSSLPLDIWIPMKLTARGSTLELAVDGIKIATVTNALRRGQIGALLQGNGPCGIRNLAVETDAPVCFVVMQFTQEFNTLYTDVIRPVCEAFGYRVVRADDFYTSGQIIEDVTQSIRTASLIIADVTPDNPNVFYELGFAHAIGKATVLLSDKKRERLPFDIAGFRTIFYDNTIGGKSSVETRLKQHLDAFRQN